MEQLRHNLTQRQGMYATYCQCLSSLLLASLIPSYLASPNSISSNAFSFAIISFFAFPTSHQKCLPKCLPIW